MEDNVLLAVAYYCGVAAVFVVIFTAIAGVAEFITADSAKQIFVIAVGVIFASVVCIRAALKGR